MHSKDAVFLDELCPKLRVRRWRQSIHVYTNQRCIYCGKPSESIDHLHPRAHGGLSVTENCVPACLSCNGHKSDAEVFDWYRRQRFYDPRRAMAIRAWMDGDLRLALRLLQWAQPLEQHLNQQTRATATCAVRPPERTPHQTRQASNEWCLSQIVACDLGSSGANRRAAVSTASATMLRLTAERTRAEALLRPLVVMAPRTN